MGDILKTHNLTKQFKKFTAVQNLNMNVKQGEIYGFLGENGAGKTTTIRMIMGLIKSTSGEIEIFSKKYSNKNKEMLKRIGSMIEYPGFYPNLTAYENLDIHRRMMGVHDKGSIIDSLKITGIEDVKDKKVKEFSLGMKQRLGISRAILHHPEFLILDEPTNGLDPGGIKEIRELILDLNKNQGITFLISSHILSEIQQMATKIGIINKGTMIEEIDYEKLQMKNRQYINLIINNDKRAAIILEEKLNIRDYEIYERNTIRIYEKLNIISEMNRTMIENNIDVKEICIKSSNLEDYFLKLIGKSRG